MELQTVRTLLLAAAILAAVQCVSSNARLIIAPKAILTNIHRNGTESATSQRIFNLLPWLTGYFETDRIVGGEYATEGQYPFMAAVHRLLGRGVMAQCGGTIISKRWILTAGHCVSEHPRKFYVIFGVTDKSGIGYDSNNGHGIAMMTTHSIVHPGYKSTSNDIGLLYMPSDIPFTSKIQPLSLPSRYYMRQSFARRKATVVGWGRDEHSDMGTKRLKYAILRTISNTECSHYWNVNEKNICTAAGTGHDACQGDSGGPLLVTENGRYLQVGIVSYGDADCPSRRPGVFTRVTPYLDWINSVTQRGILTFMNDAVH